MASVKETRWVLWRVGGGITRGGAGGVSLFDCVYSGYITPGCAGGALVGCYEPTCQMLLFAFTLSLPSSDTQTYSHKHVQYRYPVHCTLLGTMMSCAGGKFEGIEGSAVTDCYCICTCTVVPLSTDDASALIPVAKRSRGVTSEGSLSQAFGLQCQPCILTTVINHLHSQQLA